ncbi:hypothetical protein PTI98_002118 [Pleurotus ostreatus]|nr:hypothetical protein PTI98_002118 [Pleurotus ostreatus]
MSILDRLGSTHRRAYRVNAGTKIGMVGLWENADTDRSSRISHAHSIERSWIYLRSASPSFLFIIARHVALMKGGMPELSIGFSHEVLACNLTYVRDLTSPDT